MIMVEFNFDKALDKIYGSDTISFRGKCLTISSPGLYNPFDYFFLNLQDQSGKWSYLAYSRVDVSTRERNGSLGDLFFALVSKDDSAWHCLIYIEIKD